MKEYKLGPDGMKSFQKWVLVRTIPTLVVIAGIVVYTTTTGVKSREELTTVLPLTIAIFLLTISIGLYRGLKRQRRLMESYTLSITDNAIMREQLNTPPLCLHRAEVRQIVKAKGGSFTIRGKSSTDRIYVPAQISGHAELEAALQEICSIQSRAMNPLLQFLVKLVPFASIGLFFCLYSTNNKTAVAASGTLLTGILVWSLIAGQRSRNIDRQTKRKLLWIIVVLASVIGVTVLKLTGQMTD